MVQNMRIIFVSLILFNFNNLAAMEMAVSSKINRTLKEQEQTIKLQININYKYLLERKDTVRNKTKYIGTLLGSTDVSNEDRFNLSLLHTMLNDADKDTIITVATKFDLYRSQKMQGETLIDKTIHVGLDGFEHLALIDLMLSCASKRPPNLLHLCSSRSENPKFRRSVVKLLIEKYNYPVNEVREEYAALHYAVLRRDIEMIKLLLKNKADPLVMSEPNGFLVMAERGGHTSLFLADYCIKNNNIKLQIINLLMEAIEDIDYGNC